LDPSSAVAGAPTLVMTGNGSGVANGAEVVWNQSQHLSTQFLSSSQLRAIVPDTLIGPAGTASVVGYQQGFTTTSVPFLIAPTPIITSLDPPSTIVGGAAFNLTVNGSGFADGAVVEWDGAVLPTTFVSATRLTATIGANLITATGRFQITVVLGRVI